MNMNTYSNSIDVSNIFEITKRRWINTLYNPKSQNKKNKETNFVNYINIHISISERKRKS